MSAAFNLDGTRVVTATGPMWDVELDKGTLDDWAAIAARSPFVLVGGVLMRDAQPLSGPKSTN